VDVIASSTTSGSLHLRIQQDPRKYEGATGMWCIQ